MDTRIHSNRFVTSDGVHLHVLEACPPGADTQDPALPVIAFINGLDRERADLDSALESLHALDTHPVLLDAPFGEGASDAVLDVLHRLTPSR